jgi:hypothetical protein
MKFKSGLLMLFLLVVSAGVYAQDTSPSAAETAENLKAHLLDVQGKEETLRARLAELDEAIKPENIERSLAGVGSTRPEELRESRRRQLTIQRDGLQSQLQLLETERQRLEAALANAEALAYHESARPTHMMSAKSPRQYQWLLLGSGGLAALALGGGALFYRRKVRHRSV